jgi:hypothetical protein
MNNSEDKYSTAVNGEDDLDLENGYDVIVGKTNKDKLHQPACCMADILPKLPFSAIVVGRSGSGKTVSMTSILKNKNMLKDAFDFIFFFSGVKPDKEIIKDLNLQKDCVFVNFKEEDVKNICDKLEKHIENNGFNESTPVTCMIFDDCLNNIDFLKSPTMTKLATANRHMNITYFLLSQYYKKIPPVVRMNASYIMYFPASLIENEKLADEMTPPNMSKKEFLTFVNYATKDKHSFLGINNKSDNKLRKNFSIILS